MRVADTRRRLHILAITAAAVAMFGAPAQAQRVEFQGRGEYRLDERIRAILEGQNHMLIVRDTLLGVNDTLPGNVLVVGATVRVEGVIAGDLVIVDANVFLRPSARVLGNVVNIAGGYYPSAQSTVLGRVEDYPNAPYDVVYGENVRRIVGTRHPRLFQPDGFRGLRMLSYDRVSGMTISLGARYLLPSDGAFEPFISGFGEYYSQRGDVGGGGEFGVLRDNFTIATGAQRVTRTNEDWIYGPLRNSISYLTVGNDYRNYYRADRYYLRADWHKETLTRNLTIGAWAGRENAASLRAGEPWTLFGPDSLRPNPPVGPSDNIVSLTLNSSAAWRRPTYQGNFDVALEFAVAALGGDLGFARFLFDTNWVVPGFANHTLEVRGHFQGPFPGTDSLPRQRWSIIGGSGTLWTFQIGEFRGDRVVFVRTDYAIPFPSSFRAPLLGPLTLDLLYRVGMAWSYERSRSLEQNIGLQLGTPLVYVHVVTNPRDFTDDMEFGIGLHFPPIFNLPPRSPE